MSLQHVTRTFIAFITIRDWYLGASLVVLYALGLVASISIAQGGNEGRVARQLVFVGSGLALAIGFARTATHRLRAAALPCYAAMLALLGLVLVAGVNIRGTRGWFSFGFFNLQPVEFMKLALVLMLAAYFEKSRFLVSSWKRFLVSGIFSGIPILLVLKQPDVGSALVLGVIWLVLALSQLSVRRVLFLAGLGIIIATIAWLFLLKPYHKERMFVVLNPQLDPYGVGYNTRQALIAIGSGMLTGRGIGAGSQGHLRFLPEVATDFPFAIIAEELGFVGALIVCVALMVVIGRTMYAAQHVRDDFSSFLAFGIGVWIFFQSFVNLGMSLGLLPVIGLPLPFISYGGSSILAVSCAAGIVLGMRTVRAQSE